MIVCSILAIIQLLLMIYICYTELKRKSPVIFMWATLLIMFGIIHFIFCFLEQNEYSYLILSEVSLFVILFEITYWMGRVISRKKPQKVKGFKIDKENESNYKWLTYIFGLIMFGMIYTYITKSGGIFNSSWGSMRAYVTGRNYLSFGQFFEFLYFVMGGLGCYYLVIHKYTYFIYISIGELFLTLLTRNRIMILPLVVGIITFFLLNIKRIKFIYFIYGAIAAIAVIYLVYGIRVFRHYGTLAKFINNASIKEIFEKINYQIKTSDGELGLRKYFYEFIKNHNNYDGFNKGSTYIRMLMVYIPSKFSFGIKPADFAVTMGWATTGKVGQSIHPTLFGDVYANFSFVGVVCGYFWAKYANVCDQLVNMNKQTVYKILSFVLLGVSFVIIARGSVYNGFVYVAYGMPVLLLIDYYITRIVLVVGGRKLKFK